MTRMSSLHLVRTPISIMIEGSADGSIEVAITPGMRQTLWYNNNNPFHVQISMTISNKKKSFVHFVYYTAMVHILQGFCPAFLVISYYQECGLSWSLNYSHGPS